MVIIVIPNIKIVPQAKAYVIERLGSYYTTWQNGLHFKIPFVDRISKTVLTFVLPNFFTKTGLVTSIKIKPNITNIAN